MASVQTRELDYGADVLVYLQGPQETAGTNKPVSSSKPAALAEMATSR